MDLYQCCVQRTEAVLGDLEMTMTYEESEAVIQPIMDAAYAKWQGKNWSQQQFWMHLDYIEKVAVYVGNLNYQVENGGFYQWVDNLYNECLDELKIILDEINTHASRRVKVLATAAVRIVRELEEDNDWFDWRGGTDEMDNEYYELSGEFLSDTAVYIQKLMEDESND